MELRDHQNQIISDVRQSYGKGNRRIVLQMHVGAGKTVVAAEIARSAVSKLKKVLFLVPRRQLAYQAVQTFTNYGINTGLIMAGEKPLGLLSLCYLRQSSTLVQPRLIVYRLFV